MKARILTACAGVLLVSCVSAWAVPVTFQFTGQVTYITDGGHVLDGDVAVGDTFTGTYTFESTLPDSYPYSDPDGRHGYYSSPTSVMHVGIGPFDLWSGSRNLIKVENGTTIDTLSLGSSGFKSSGLYVEGMVMKVHDLAGMVFNDDSLPVVLPPFSAFNLSSFQIEGSRIENDPFGFAINGVILTLTPEPASLVFLLAGGMLIVQRRGCY